MRQPEVPGRDHRMEVTGGSCRLGLWFVHVWHDKKTIHRVRFSTTGIDGEVPEQFRQYCAGHNVDLTKFESVAVDGDSTYSRIYRAVREVPYGRTSTYGEIAQKIGTAPRVVGQAMANNPTPLVIPCHRIVAANGIGGFSPEIGIKELLLTMEKKTLQKLLVAKKTT
jgi:methylated-DNA-[protein]-cysteine S-methyltransferase